jgi:filamentous hemagglutinin
MNNNNYRLIYSRLRETPDAVSELAKSPRKQAGRSAVVRSPSAATRNGRFALRQIAFAVLAMTGVLPEWSVAQIIPSGPNSPSVISTQNGLSQVNINRPSGAGVSMNTYGQFDVQQRGAILNNSPAIVQTQQAGMINGNPNLGPGDAARVIVNQVNSNAASQINGYVEVAGRRAEVVIANGSGISVNGGGFINTSRAILTTGTPNFAADGSLSGFNVSHGDITVQGAGLNASEEDHVDLIARAVQANAAIYAKNLNVVAGANSVDHETLDATRIAGDGPPPRVSIDVSQLGGMYANRILDARHSGDFEANFDNRFSFVGLATASTVGAFNGMTGVSMFKWAEIPNRISNISTFPGFVIRVNGFIAGQATGKAAQGAVKEYEAKK